MLIFDKAGSDGGRSDGERSVGRAGASLGETGYFDLIGAEGTVLFS